MFINLLPVDETYIKVICSDKCIEMDISDRFTFTLPNKNFYGKKNWDGKIRLYDRRRKLLYKGLMFELALFAKKRNYEINIDPSLKIKNDITLRETASLIKEICPCNDKGEKLIPYPFQIKGVYNMLKRNRTLQLAATSSGKSLMFYLAIRIYQLMPEFFDKKIFLIVPNKSLVEQMYSDFAEFSCNDDDWSPDIFIQRVNGDYSKFINKDIIITTWQSISRLDQEMIRNAGAIFVDEVHGVKGQVLKKSIESARNCKIRHGLTGTLDGMECNELQAQGLFGHKEILVTAKENIEAGRCTPVHINSIILDYSLEIKKDYDQCIQLEERQSQKYNREIEFINELECRKEFIHNLTNKLKGNTLVLFDRVDGYGKILYEEKLKTHKNTYLICGEVGKDDRERIRKILEEENDAVVFATTRLMSTGVSIKNLHNIIMSASSKSVIQVLQTLGRLMRKHKSKEVAQVYDVVDKLDYGGKKNYVLRHVSERVKFYTEEGHPIKFISKNLK